jgi:flagellar protein FliS
MVPQKNPQAAQQYLKTRVMTATPEQLQIMLYDGAIRFIEQAKVGIEKRNYEQLYINITKAQKIVTELLGALKPEVYPELCERLAAVYRYVYRRLVEGSKDKKVECFDEAVKLLRYQRETWTMVLDQAGKEKAAKAAAGMNVPSPDPRMEATISMSA